MKKTHFLSLAFQAFLIASISLSYASCSSEDPTEEAQTISPNNREDSSNSSTTSGDDEASEDTAQTVQDVSTDTSNSLSGVTSSQGSTTDDVYTQTLQIVFSGTNATISGQVSGVSTSVDGAVVTISSTAPNVNYIITGTTTNGGLDISSTQPLMLTLNGAGIIRSAYAPIRIQSAVSSYIKSLAGSTNKLIDGSSNASKATLYSAGALNFLGTGTLTISSTGSKSDAIQTAGNILIEETTLVIPSSTRDAIRLAGSDFTMKSGHLQITSTETDVKGINGNNSTAGAETAVNLLGGTVKISVSGDQSKAIRSRGTTTIAGAIIDISTTGNTALETSGSGYDPSYCTAFKSNDFIFSSGSVNVSASGMGAKGISPDGSYTMTGGTYTFTSTGGGATYTNESGVTDAYSSSGLNPDGACYLYGGTITMTASGAGGKGISVDGDLVVGQSTTSTGPSISVKTTGQKFYVSGSGQNADYSNPKGIKSDGNVTINSGVINITCTQDGGEGLESKATMNINGGTLNIQTVDDCLNASSSINISGGRVYAYATGNDAVDSNGTLRITGGLLVAISAANAPETGIDCDQNTFAITGGTVIGIGGERHSAPSSSATTQRTIHYASLGMTGGQYLAIQSSSGGNLLSLKLPSLNYSNGALLFSSSELEAGTYTIYRGGAYSGGNSYGGYYYTGGTYTTGTQVGSFTSSSIITTIGGSSGGWPRR